MLVRVFMIVGSLSVDCYHGMCHEPNCDQSLRAAGWASHYMLYDFPISSQTSCFVQAAPYDSIVRELVVLA